MRERFHERLLTDLEVASPDTLALAAELAPQAGLYRPALAWLRDMRSAGTELEGETMRLRDHVLEELRGATPEPTREREVVAGTLASVQALLDAGAPSWAGAAADAVEALEGADPVLTRALAAALRARDSAAAYAALASLR